MTVQGFATLTRAQVTHGQIHQLVARPDFVQLFGRMWPTTSSPCVVKICTGRNATC